MDSAGELDKEGYETAFFHGAQNGSMGFEAFARSTGFGQYYGRTEFDADPRFGGENEFDGTWAIWDEPFLPILRQEDERNETALHDGRLHRLVPCAI